MSITQVKKRLEELDVVDFKNLSYDKYFEYLKETFQGYTQALVSIKINPDTSENGEYGIFRARLTKEGQPFSSVNDLWARPEKDVNQLGRCHNIGQSKLYCSNHLATTLIECRALENTYWVITEYDIIPEVSFSMLPVGMKSDRYINFDRTPKLVSVLDKHNFKKNTLIEKYIRKSFKQYVRDDESYKYMKTFAITDYLLKNDQAKNDLFGLIFPSVASSFNGMNFCFDSNVAPQVLSIKNIRYLKFKNFDHQKGKFYYRVISNGIVVNDKVIWA